jgi:hypothetical protein
MAKTQHRSNASATTSHPPHGLCFGPVEVGGTVGSEPQPTVKKTPEAAPESHYELPYPVMEDWGSHPIHTSRVVRAVKCLNSHYKTVSDIARSQLTKAVKERSGHLLTLAADRTTFLNSPLLAIEARKYVQNIWSLVRKSLQQTSTSIQLAEDGAVASVHGNETSENCLRPKLKLEWEWKQRSGPGSPRPGQVLHLNCLRPRQQLLDLFRHWAI